MELKFVLNFLIGGTIFSLASYFGSQGKGFLAAIVTFFPTLTTLTFIFMYLNGGINSVEGFTKGLALLMPGWILYILVMFHFSPRLGLNASLFLGVLMFILSSVFLKKIFGLN